ncbi:MAG TPA: hypothetical protein VFI84_03700 [Candidatus Saccharimonadales bacterium]|nr:hypothetical protein [Candidatus Saccharimonadales bacterium]
MRSLHLPREEYGPLPVAEVRSLHNLAMGITRSIAQEHGSTWWVDSIMRKHRFVFFCDSGGRVGDEEKDQYLGVRVIKQAPRQWRMSISFLDNLLLEAYADSNVRELNSFIWNDQQAYGMRRVREAMGKMLVSEGIQIGEKTGFIGGTNVGTYRESRTGLTSTDCDDIANRMLGIVVTESKQAAVSTQAA